MEKPGKLVALGASGHFPAREPGTSEPPRTGTHLIGFLRRVLLLSALGFCRLPLQFAPGCLARMPTGPVSLCSEQ